MTDAVPIGSNLLVDPNTLQIVAGNRLAVKSTSGGGDVVGPASAVDGNLAVFDTTTGKLIKDGGAVPSAGTSLSINDGSTTVAAVATLSITGATVGGTTPNATLVVTPGAPAVGSAGVVQASDGAGAFQASGFQDNLTVPGTPSARLEDDADSNASKGFIVSPVGGAAGSGYVVAQGFGDTGQFLALSSGGTSNTPTEILNETLLGGFKVQGYNGATYSTALNITARAKSDFSGTPTSEVAILNASFVGLHVSADGTTRIETVPPGAANFPGIAGSVTWDAGFVYVCIATDTWARAAIATWP